jgi:hypothetical protein
VLLNPFSGVNLGHAAGAWEYIPYNMLQKHMTVHDAVAATNAYLPTIKDNKHQPITEQYFVVETIMSRLSNNARRSIMAILLLGALPALSESQDLNDRETVLTRTRDFLQAFYPELLGKGMLLNLRTSQSIDNSWRQVAGIRFDVQRYDPLSERMLNPPHDLKTGKRLPPADNQALLQGLIRFNERGYLHEFSLGDSDLIRSTDNDKIQKLVELHPEWSETQALAALREAGALYGPEKKEELLKTLQLGKLEPFLGSSTIRSVEFVVFHGAHVGNFAGLYWTVHLDTTAPDGKRASYTLILEPFEGRLRHAFQNFQ